MPSSPESQQLIDTPGVSRLASNDKGMSKLYKSVGQSSKIAGIGLGVLSIVFLLLAVYDGFFLFEVDSVIAFMAAVFLLFKDPRARVQSRVLDAMLLSSDQAIQELSAPAGAGFTYVTKGDEIEDVVVVPGNAMAEATAGLPNGATAGLPNGATAGTYPAELTPPGRRLAELYKREAGLMHVRLTMEVIGVSLPDVMRENFGLARAVSIDSTEDGVKVTLHGSSSTCTCGEYDKADAGKGYVGCTVASFLAVLVVTATGRPVSLDRCAHDTEADTWTVPMSLGQKPGRAQ
jgi:hypothetical protein